MPSALHKLGEQAELGVEVILEAWMIILMVARDVREGGCGDVHAVETVLIKPVAGGFQRQALDAIGLHLLPAGDGSSIGSGVVWFRLI